MTLITFLVVVVPFLFGFWLRGYINEWYNNLFK